MGAGRFWGADNPYEPPGPVGAAFIASRHPISIIMGPAGSGKTVCSVFKGPRLAAEYWPVCKDGWVRFKLACIRDTYRDFARTALDSWYEVFPEDHPWTVSHEGGQDRPVRHHLRWRAMRGGREIVVDFQMETGAIGDANIEKFIKGYQISAGWMNECDMLDDRVPGLFFQRTGRYPAVDLLAPSELERVSRDGAEAFRMMGLRPEPGETILPRIVWGDMNPPDIGNWSYDRMVKNKLKNPGYKLFKQPSGLSPRAENRRGKPRSSYELEAATQTEYDVRRMVHGEFGYALDGKPVYPEFKLERHVADQPLTPIKGVPIGIGLDAGGSPAAGIGQFLPNGQLLMLAELCADPGTGPRRFSEMLTELLLTRFRDFAIAEAWADPSSMYGADKIAGEMSWVQIVAQAMNIPISWPESNEPAVRQEAVRWYLGAPIDATTERLIVDPTCERTIGGFAAHYKLTKQASAGATDKLVVAKNEYSHIHDAWQYLCLGHRGRSGVVRDAAKMGRPDNVIGLRERQSRQKPGSFDVWNV